MIPTAQVEKIYNKGFRSQHHNNMYIMYYMVKVWKFDKIA